MLLKWKSWKKNKNKSIKIICIIGEIILDSVIKILILIIKINLKLIANNKMISIDLL